MSLDRKLDLVGVVLLFVGLLTLLSLISASNNLVTASWLTFLEKAFGWGAYLFPVGLIAVGLWLVLRSFEHVPHVGIERLIGVCLCSQPARLDAFLLLRRSLAEVGWRCWVLFCDIS
jgi:hypothetical protein